MSIKRFSLEYNQVNGRTFSVGDVLSGRVIIVASKETKAQVLVVKAKGCAEVKWYEQDGPNMVSYQDEKKYFYWEHIILQDKNKGDGSEIIRQGRTVYPFTFVIPDKDMPSSYEGKWGRITYNLQAELTQTIWSTHKTSIDFPFLTKSEFPFASKSEMSTIGLKERQSATIISFYGSGKVILNVTSEKMGLMQGETMEVSVEVINGSNGESVLARTSRTIINVLSIPGQLSPTFCNCSLIKLEYTLKVTLGDPLARGPDIKLPLVILLGSSSSSNPKTVHGT